MTIQIGGIKAKQISMNAIIPNVVQVVYLDIALMAFIALAMVLELGT